MYCVILLSFRFCLPHLEQQQQQHICYQEHVTCDHVSNMPRHSWCCHVQYNIVCMASITHFNPACGLLQYARMHAVSNTSNGYDKNMYSYIMFKNGMMVSQSCMVLVHILHMCPRIMPILMSCGMKLV